MSIFALFLFFLIISNSCEDVVYKSPASGQVKGEVHGIIKDNYNSEPIINAKIKYVDNGKNKTVTSDSLGYYSITDLNSGSYRLTIESHKEGSNYITNKATVRIPPIDSITNATPPGQDTKYSVNKNVFLFKKNAGVSGKVYRENSNGNKNLASDIVVIAKVASNKYETEPSKFADTTNSSGVYNFEKSLPAAPMKIYTLPHINDGNKYDGVNIGSYNLIPEVNKHIDNVVANLASKTLRLLDRPHDENTFPIKSDINITFSKSIYSEVTNVTLTNTNTNEELAFNTNWESNNTSLTIDPHLILAKNTTYRIKIDGQSIDGLDFNKTIMFSTKELDKVEIKSTNIQKVDGQTVVDFERSSDINLTFTKSINTEKIEVNLVNSSTSNELTFESNWKNNNKTLHMDPYYVLEHSSDYTLTISGEQTENYKSFQKQIDFSTEGPEIEKVKLLETNLRIVEGRKYSHFNKNENFKLLFNIPIDGTKSSFRISDSTYIKSGNINLIENSSGTMMVKIVQSEQYDLQEDTNYTLEYSVEAKGNYSSVSGNIKFKTED